MQGVSLPIFRKLTRMRSCYNKHMCGTILLVSRISEVKAKGSNMNDTNKKTIRVSVRNLVEFILRSGDLDSTMTGPIDPEAMQKGSRLHRKIQKQQSGDYTPEFMLSLTIPIDYKEYSFEIILEGRADGVIAKEEEPFIIIDEIKSSYLDVDKIEKPFGVHLAQAKCYAYMYANLYEYKTIGVRMTYANLETEAIRYFHEEYAFLEIKAWFDTLINEYAKWAYMEVKWTKQRNESIKLLEFPFEYREGQKKLVTGVYQTILRGRKLYIEAPTGVGKTISTVFPAVKAMGEEKVEKIFYLTAKTITRTVAEDTFRLLRERGALLKTVTITAKEKICPLEKVSCNPQDCERAKGHFDRINDALYELLTKENDINRELIEDYAKDYLVCPFEMCLDITLWADAVIGDYNYVFDPSVSLKRFFSTDKKQDFTFLIDEAHNLVDRAREMYSARIVKEDVLNVKRIVQNRSKKLAKALERLNKDLLQFKRDYSQMTVVKNIDSVVLHMMQVIGCIEEFLQEFAVFEEKEAVLDFYFDIRHFMNMYGLINELYTIYVDYTERGEFLLMLQCMDPSDNIQACLNKGKSAVFFSATLLPIRYYKEQLAGKEEDYAIYAPSPFDSEKRLLLVANDVSTAYSRRNDSEYEKIARYILSFTRAKQGNYLVFFPSYQFMDTIYQVLESIIQTETEDSQAFMNQIMVQSSKMTELEKEEFLCRFEEVPQNTLIGFCVMGGIFSEGIDLTEDRLIGAVIVGTGLPMVCNEKELFRNYYEERKGAGFDYAYLYNGMNKVLQSAGRVIRTARDRGAILLLDYRFTQNQYQALFPAEWYPFHVVNQNTINEQLALFWEKDK